MVGGRWNNTRPPPPLEALAREDRWGLHQSRRPLWADGPWKHLQLDSVSPSRAVMPPDLHHQPSQHLVSRTPGGPRTRRSVLQAQKGAATLPGENSVSSLTSYIYFSKE